MAEKEKEGQEPEIVVVRRRYFTRRNAMLAGGVLAVTILLLGLLGVILYRTGQVDTYTKNRFVEKMAEMGIVFDAEVFRLSLSPLELELRNATFNDKVTGEKLFFIREAHLKMTLLDYFALRASRDIRIDTTDITGAEVWVKFDENGESNFKNVHLVEDEKGTAVNFKYDSINFSLKDSVIHFGDISRKISANANNLVFLFSPTDPATSDELKRYNFDLSASNSNFTYDEKIVEDISVKAVGIADANGAEFRSVDLKTPIGETTLSGNLIDWASPQYNFDISSTLDLTQASSIFGNETSLNGVGNFKGKVTGHGETYHIEGEADAASLRAGGVALKAVNVNATVEGTNLNYEAHGNAVAEMLTFDDFRIDFVKMAGNVRGTGTDFRWVGELQAAAVKSPEMSIAGLFLSDALAEYKDKQMRASAGTGRAQKFAIGDNTFDSLTARSLRIGTGSDSFDISSPGASARAFTTKAYKLNNISGSNLRVKNVGQRTDVDATGLRADSMTLKDNVARNVRADRFHLTDQPGPTDVTLLGLQADRVVNNDFLIAGVASPELTIHDVAAETIIYADKLRVAKIDTSGAVLGSLNIGGVRLTIRQGVVEGRSNDVDAGNITIKKTNDLKDGGTLNAVRIMKPVFVLEPSGRYRASADMSIGGGTVGSISLGNATAKVDISNDRVAVNNVNASVMEGQLTGTAVIALNSRVQSRLDGSFVNLDIGKLLALQGGRVIPIEGQTTGQVNLTFPGRAFRSASGTLNADITASAGSADSNLIPITGKVNVTGTNGLFNIDTARLNAPNSSLDASGRFDLRNTDSNLAVNVRSTDASEVDRLARLIIPEVETQMTDLNAAFAGDLAFNGTITGNLTDPSIDGHGSVGSLVLKGRDVGSVSTDIAVSPLTGTELTNGKLQQADGGTATFAISIPKGGSNNLTVNADLTNINAGSLLAALPITLPEQIADFNGKTSGKVAITGLPNNAQGEVNLSAATGTIAGQAFDNLKVRAVFTGTLVDLQQAEMRIGSGNLAATGRYDRGSKEFNFDVTGQQIPAGLMLAFAPKFDTPVSGDLDFTAKATGFSDRTPTYNINFSGASPNVTIGQNSIGQVTFKGVTQNQMLTADLTADLNGHPQIVAATVNLGNEDLPFTAVTDFNQSPLGPFLALIPRVKDMPITGTGTGRIEFGGNLSRIDATGKRVFSADGLNGTANFSQLSLLVQDTPLNAAEPIAVRFNMQEIIFDRARFSGGGSNMTIAGTKSLTENGINDLSIDGRINLNLLNVVSKDTFFSGFADTSVRLAGPNTTARLSGTANLVNASVATFLGSDRFQFDRVNARVIFTTNQFEVDDASGYLGGGKFTGSGGGLMQGLALQAFRFDINGNNVTVPLPKDFNTTGDARLEISGIRPSPRENLQLTIAGRVYAKRSLYSKDIDLASVVTGRRDPTLSSSAGGLAPPRFDLVIEGRDALIVKNNIADLTASVSLVLTGDAENPRITGRITANSGTILFRKDRYVVQRGVLEFPPDSSGIDPVINLQAESEIAGYQIFVNLSGPLKDSEQLNATVRSSPALPQADVVSLITTGNLANSAGGIPTLASTGINTAAEILTDSIINNPARKATDRLFGLNVFEIDPIISGTQTNPTARLTVGRQINNNLRVTYSTNLSQDQNQVLALEYRVSNKLSFIAQYEQRPLSNVTRARNNFSFEVRFRRRF